MKLVIEYGATDNNTYAFALSQPIDYNSIQEAEKDLKEIVEKCHGRNFSFAKCVFRKCDFWGEGSYIAPEILELEDWWEQNK